MRDIEPNGGYVVIKNPKGEILLAFGSFGYWMLPGGGAKRGERLIDAAVRETLHETGLILVPKKMSFIAQFPQKVVVDGEILPFSGIINLYTTRDYEGDLLSEPTHEVLKWAWMSLDEVLKLYDKGLGPVRTSYARMMVYADNIERGLLPAVHEAVLAEPVPLRPQEFI